MRPLQAHYHYMGRTVAQADPIRHILITLHPPSQR